MTPILLAPRFDTYLRRLRPAAIRADYGLCAVVTCVLALVALLFDVPTARFLRVHPPHGDLRRLIMLGETFGFGISVGLIILTAAVLDLRRRRWMPQLLAYAFGPGVCAIIVKSLIARDRPLTLDLTANVWSTFVGMLPIWNLGDAWSYRIQSFPSGHTATAVGLAIGLSSFYPHGRWLFAGFALMAAVQRVVAGAHFVSDTLFGAAIAFACAFVFAKVFSRPV